MKVSLLPVREVIVGFLIEEHVFRDKLLPRRFNNFHINYGFEEYLSLQTKVLPITNISLFAGKCEFYKKRKNCLGKLFGSAISESRETF